MRQIVLGLLGKNLSHSKSKSIYEDILQKKIHYKLLDYNREDIPPLKDLFDGLHGLSVTAPYKQFLFPFVKVDSISQHFNAINCIKKDGHHYLATITDYHAVEEIFVHLKSRYKIIKCIILGDGVMSQMTQYILQRHSRPFEIFSRKQTKNFSQLDLSPISGKGTLIINTCSRSYSYEKKLEKGPIFWDYNYNFDKHLHLKMSLNEKYIDGMELLYRQAKHAIQFWNL